MAFPKQVTNRNLLSPIGFKFILAKYPKVDFFSNKASIPGINIGVAVQPTYLKDLPIVGDKLEFSDLTLNFLVDEDMENYTQIYNWLMGLGYPETVQQSLDYIQSQSEFVSNPGFKDLTSDGTLQILNSNYQPSRSIIFQDLFPVSISTLDFDATQRDYNYFTAQVVFKYSIYKLV